MDFEGNFYQVGVVVRDIDRGMETYSRLLGIGPFWRMDTRYEARHRDWHGVVANKNAFARWGHVYLEMVAPGIGSSPAREWLEARGEGIFHLGYATDNVSQRPANVACIFESFAVRLANGEPAIAFLDTVDALGYYVELADRKMADGLVARIDAEIAGTT